MSKLLTFAVPCYNSAAYMDHCVRTLLTGGDDIEIILVDDGSTQKSRRWLAALQAFWVWAAWQLRP